MRLTIFASYCGLTDHPWHCKVHDRPTGSRGSASLPVGTVWILAQPLPTMGIAARCNSGLE